MPIGSESSWVARVARPPRKRQESDPSPARRGSVILRPMRLALAVTGGIALFVLGFLVAACGSGSTSTTTEQTFTPGPAPSQLGTVQHGQSDHPPRRAGITSTVVTTVGYLDTNGNQSTATLTYTTTQPGTGLQTMPMTAVTFTQTAEP
jgi:hypothetical protein